MLQGVARNAHLGPRQSLEFHLELLKCLVMEIDHFEKFNERQFDIPVDDLVSQRFERTMNNAFGFRDRSGCFGDIRVG
jgi:GGDEF domain-containing protein